MNGGLVEAEKRLRRLIVAAFHHALEHEMPSGTKVLRQDLQETFVEIVGMNVGQEAESAEVDAQYGDLGIAHLPRRTQDGAVAAEYEREIGGRKLGEVLLLP